MIDLTKFSFSSIIKPIIDAIKFAPIHYLTFSICSGFLLFGGHDILEKIGVFYFAQDHRSIIGIIFIVSTTYLVIYSLSVPYKIGVDILIEWIENRNINRGIVKYLNTLTEEEKDILREYVWNQSKSSMLDAHDGVVVNLMNNSIIDLASNRGSIIDGFAFNINACAWDYLNENQAILGTKNS